MPEDIRSRHRVHHGQDKQSYHSIFLQPYAEMAALVCLNTDVDAVVRASLGLFVHTPRSQHTNHTFSSSSAIGRIYFAVIEGLSLNS